MINNNNNNNNKINNSLWPDHLQYDVHGGCDGRVEEEGLVNIKT